jgi:major membrane immunogen (membrane-anchored lipoprotein)
LDQFEQYAIEHCIANSHHNEKHQIKGEDDRYEGAHNGHHLEGKKSHGQSKDQGTDTDVSINTILFHIILLFTKNVACALDDNTDEIGKDAHYRPGNEHKDQNAGDSFFEVCVLTKEMTSIEKKAYEEDYAQNNGENGPDGIRDVRNGILDAPNLGIAGLCEEKSNNKCY